ncbi:DUF3784 domain-containing protein [Cytobacillus massiliigabonensis]|uniref:DUF3784 domain-containing protein n=1 Tax=Cytobacillus massiliigabonensis TaxID=1871011 RepID=UPI000C8172A6|nr:DUF3784 domain-containing protein [Cytobacillus massiliigabonensis]
MMGLISTQIIVSVLFILLGWAIRYKKAYWLISGFASRAEHEKKQLITNGSPQRTGMLLLSAGIGMLVLLPLLFTSFKYAVEVQIGFMLLYLLGGLVYLSKFEIPSKRKRSYTISIILFIAVIGSIGTLTVSSYQGYDLIVKNSRFEITGMYGDEWNLKDIKRIELMEEMPEVLARTNGVGLPALSKGHFKVKDYGKSLLFVQKGSSPYIYIELKSRKIFINDKDPKQTKNWHEKLQKKVGNSK